MDTTYFTLKSIHLLGVVVFLGNIIVTGWWKFMADRTGNPAIIAFSQRQVTLTDYVFTVGGVALILIGGMGNVYYAGFSIFEMPWLAWGISLFIASGIIWVVVLLPIQSKLATMAREFAGAESIPEEYWRLARIWNIWGTAATLLPMLNLYFMVFKPL